MTAPTPTTSSTVPVGRYPVRADVDGDFALEELLALPAGDALVDDAPRPPAPNSPTPEGPTPEDAAPDGEALLRVVERSAVVRPPVHLHLDGLTPTVAHAWLVRAARCIALSRDRTDLRFLNAACKLTGAVGVYVGQRPSRGERAGAEGDWSRLSAGLGTVARLLDHATAQLVETLANRPPPAEAATGDAPGPARADTGRRFTRPSRARIVVLAGAGSSSAGRLDAAAAAIGLPITALCWYQPRPETQTPHTTFGSNYATAWYPPAPLTAAPDELPVVRHAASSTTARSWPEVTAALRRAEADLVVLVGMPIVPESVLGDARLGVLNAHNGALPTVRGMDAVGWALLTGQPVVCTLHRVRRGVDTGEVITAEQVPVEPLPTLGERVKATQLRLLLAAAADVAATGALPAMTAQPEGTGRQFYRLHPHLKRVLDRSPYGEPTRAHEPAQEPRAQP